MPALPSVPRLLLATLSFLTALSVHAEGKPRIVWTVRDMPPFSILEGPRKGQGVVDKMLALLRTDMPQYEHILSVANRARANQMVNNGVLTCDPGMLWSEERAKQLYFSIPTLGILTNGVVVRKADEAELAPFIKGGEFDLASFIQDSRYTLGTLVERSYGQQIDAALKQAKPNVLVVHHGIEATLSLLRMQQHQRLTAVLGYWPELHYQGEAAGISLNDLSFYSVQGVPTYQMGYVACTRSPEGLQAIKDINLTVRRLREGEVIKLYADWLDGATRDAYLKAAKGFFNE